MNTVRSGPGVARLLSRLYEELAGGKTYIEAVIRTRKELEENYCLWSSLRVFCGETSSDKGLVKGKIPYRGRSDNSIFTYLKGTQMKVLEKGFIGRRRHVQEGTRILQGLVFLSNGCSIFATVAGIAKEKEY
jgi:hypothetical protein